MIRSDAIVDLFFSPGVVETRFADGVADVSSEIKKKIFESCRKIQPLGFINSHQISEGIIFLCESEMTTGASLIIDGGLLHSSKI